MYRNILCAVLCVCVMSNVEILCGQQPDGEPQGELTKHTLKIGKLVVMAEVANTDTTRAMGLMFRKKLEKDSGMLFVMNRPARAAFWMKNTLIALSIAYLDKNGRILEIHDMIPLSEKTVESQFANVAYALEMNRDWFSNNGVVAGDLVAGLP